MGTSLTVAAHSPLPAFHRQTFPPNQYRSNLDPRELHSENY